MGSTTRDVEVGDGVLRTRVSGAGRPLLFVHGALADGGLWDGVVRRLEARYTCVVPDLPLGSHRVPLRTEADRTPAGHAARLQSLIAALGLDEVTVVANDSGGAITQVLCAERPARVARVVLTNCDALEVFPPRAYAYLGWLSHSPAAMAVLARLLYTVPALARLPNAYGWLADEIPPELLARWLAPSLDGAIRTDLAGFFRAVRPEVTLAAAEALRTFDRPVLLAWGTRDPFFRIELAERLAAVLPDARIERFDARCYVPLDQPEALAAAIDRFAAPLVARATA